MIVFFGMLKTDTGKVHIGVIQHVIAKVIFKKEFLKLQFQSAGIRPDSLNISLPCPALFPVLTVFASGLSSLRHYRFFERYLLS